MATCADCGKEIKDGVWTCGHCGAPVTQAAGGSGGGGPAADSYGYAPGYAPAPSQALAAPKSGLSSTTRAVIVVALLAVLAIVVVWFFLMRGASGPFVGTWTAMDASGQTIVVKRGGDDYKVTVRSKDTSGTERKYTIPAHLVGSRLEITFGDFAEAAGDDDQAAAAKTVFESMFKDFKLVFTTKDATHLQLRMEGEVVGGQPLSEEQRVTVLVKGD